MKTTSGAPKSIGFKMSPAPKRKQDKSADFANHQMPPQIPKGSPMSQDHAEEEGKV